MEKTKISLYQFYAVMVMFTASTSTVIGLGREVKQDLWILIIFSTFASIIIFLIMVFLFKKFPEDTLFIILEKVLGKYLGKFVSILYLLYFLLVSTLVLRDIGEFITMYLLVDTPVIVIHILSALAVTYAIYLGIETILRTSEINFILIELIFIILIIFVLLSNIIEVNNLLPVLENGVKPLLKSFAERINSYPFGEIIVLFLLFPKINKQEKFARVGIFALLTTSMIMLINAFINISVLGVYLYTNTAFPTLEAMRLVKFGTFFQRMDALIVIFYIVETLYKFMIYNWAINLGLKETFNLKKANYYIIPISILIVLGATYMYKDYTTLLLIGTKFIPFYVNLPFEKIIPILLIMIIFIKNFMKKKTLKR